MAAAGIRPRPAEQLELQPGPDGLDRCVGRGDFQNPILLARNADGEKMVLKVEPARTTEESQRRTQWWAAQLVASQAFQQLGANAVPYHYARAGDKEGLSCPFREFSLYSENRNVEIRNPDRMIRSMVVNAWLGDFDRIIKDDNIWLEPTGEVLLGDMGCAGLREVQAFGCLPKVHLNLFARYCTRENVEAALGDIRKLTDAEIRFMVADAVSGLPGADTRVVERLSRDLTHNRDMLRAGNPFECLLGDEPPVFRMPEKMAGKLLDAVDKHYAEVPWEGVAEVAHQAIAGRRGYAPEKGRDLETVELQLANALERHRQGRECALDLEPECFFVWQSLAKSVLTTEESLASGLGLKHSL